MNVCIILLTNKNVLDCNVLLAPFMDSFLKCRIQLVTFEMQSNCYMCVTTQDALLNITTSGLFNLRASDIAYNPFFISYAILEQNRIRLYILDKDRKLTANSTDAMTTVTLATHLNTGDTGACNLQTVGACVEVG